MNLQTSQETVSFSDWSVRIFTLHLNECFYLQTFSSLTILPRFLVVLFAKHSTQREPRWRNLQRSPTFPISVRAGAEFTPCRWLSLQLIAMEIKIIVYYDVPSKNCLS